MKDCDTTNDFGESLNVYLDLLHASLTATVIISAYNCEVGITSTKRPAHAKDRV